MMDSFPLWVRADFATLAELVRAETAADAERRAVARIPQHLREPDAAHDACTRWTEAHEVLTAALAGERDLEAGS